MNRIGHFPLLLGVALSLLVLNAVSHAETATPPSAAPVADAPPENVPEAVAEKPLEKRGKSTARKADQSQEGTHKKNIEFEDGVVEGLGKRGKDSLTQVGENDGRNRPRLYKKRLHFKEEMKEVYREMEYGK